MLNENVEELSVELVGGPLDGRRLNLPCDDCAGYDCTTKTQQGRITVHQYFARITPACLDGHLRMYYSGAVSLPEGEC